MDVVVEFLAGLIILAGAYVWVKQKFLQPGIPKDVDISNVRGVPLVKKAPHAADKTQQVEPAVETEVTPVEAAVEPVVQVETSKVEAVATVETPPLPESVPVSQPSIPEDSVLKRHYLAQREAERLNLSHPYPSDSVLRRHHESALAAQFKESKQSVKVDVPAIDNAIMASSQTSIPAATVPEDSVLKRHYLQLIQNRSAAN